MAQAKNGDTVKVHYTGKLADGEIFDSSSGKDPLQFTIGTGQVIPGFEEAVVGMNPGDSKTTEIPVDKAYGPRNEEIVMQVPLDQFPAEIKPQIGQMLELGQQGGQPVIVTITSISETTATLDANPPLAGKELIFELELVEIA